MTESKPSKSARKRAQTALQELGERLIDLTDDQLQELALEEQLDRAVRDAKSMKSRGALRRQKQLIGKLMRQFDPEPIRAAVARLSADDLRAKRLFARAERWRDTLVRGTSEDLAAFEADTGGEDLQVRELLRELDGALDERVEKTLRRQLFRRIHTVLAEDR